jgi:hypothetical protein
MHECELSPYCFSVKQDEHDPDGSWMVSYTDWEGNDGEGWMVYTYKSFTTEQEARRVANRFQDKVNNGEKPNMKYWAWRSSYDYSEVF